MKIEPRVSCDVSVPVAAQRTWQRKWRDVLHACQALQDAYAGHRLDVDDFTRRVECFFKTCHELGDWIEEQTSLAAKAYAKIPGTLELCDAVAQTAKHHTRRQSGNPITAVVVELFGDKRGIHADLAWMSNSGSGRDDALDIANRCVAEWRKFFQQNNLDPES
jgi:hypothetical protein